MLVPAPNRRRRNKAAEDAAQAALREQERQRQQEEERRLRAVQGDSWRRLQERNEQRRLAKEARAQAAAQRAQAEAEARRKNREEVDEEMIAIARLHDRDLHLANRRREALLRRVRACASCCWRPLTAGTVVCAA